MFWRRLRRSLLSSLALLLFVVIFGGLGFLTPPSMRNEIGRWGREILGWTVAIVSLFALIGAGLKLLDRSATSKYAGLARIVETFSLPSLFLLMGLVLASDDFGSIIAGALTVLLYLFGLFYLDRAERTGMAEYHKRFAELDERFPGVHDNQPPTDVYATPNEEFELFDLSSSTYLGKIARKDVEALQQFAIEKLDAHANDIYVRSEELILLRRSPISHEFYARLLVAMRDREYLILRWQPAGLLDSAAVLSGRRQP